jgi:hypothetical protein
MNIKYSLLIIPYLLIISSCAGARNASVPLKTCEQKLKSIGRLTEKYKTKLKECGGSNNCKNLWELKILISRYEFQYKNEKKDEEKKKIKSEVIKIRDKYSKCTGYKESNYPIFEFEKLK